MNNLREIKYNTHESKSRLTTGKVCHQGRIVHNQVLSRTVTIEAFAKYANIRESQARFFLESLEEFIAEEIAHGSRMEFGPFAASLSMRGGFPACNSPFDEKVNELAVELTPCKKIRQAVKSLRPINENHRNDALISNTMLSPEGIYDEMPTDGERKLSCAGLGLNVHPGAVGEGVWIENDAGEKLLEGTNIESKFSYCQFTINGHIEPGNYWVVICSRYEKTGEFLKARRRITVKNR